MSTVVSISQPPSRTFVRLKHDGIVWEVREGFQSLALASGGGADWFNLEKHQTAQVVKTGDHRTVWRVRDPKNGPVFVKVFDAPGRAGRLRVRFAGSPARREANALKESERRGIPAVAVVAVGDRRADGSSLLITREQPNAQPLPAAWNDAIDHGPASRSRERRLEILVCTAKLLTEARSKGLVQLDGHPGNILVTQSPNERPYAAYVDLARCAWTKGPAPERRQIDAIAQLYQYAFDKTTRTDRLRFARECVRDGQPARAGDDCLRARRRRLIQRIEASRAQIADRLARHRDRRLRRDGKYFHRISLGNGWRGVVVVCLARRHRFPERGVPDRSVRQWRRDLEPLIAAVERDDPPSVSGDSGPLCLGSMRASSLLEAWLWTILGSPARRAFERCHRRRHRDEQPPLVLGYLERRGRNPGGIGLIWQAHSIANRTEFGQNEKPASKVVD